MSKDISGYGKAKSRKIKPHNVMKNNPQHAWPDPSPTGFVTNMGRVLGYKALVETESLKLSGCSPTTDGAQARPQQLAHTCILKGSARRHGSKRQWAQIVQRYLQAAAQGKKVVDDLESRVEARVVPDTDVRVGLRGQRGVFVKPGVCISKHSPLKSRVMPYSGLVFMSKDARKLLGSAYSKMRPYFFSLERPQKKVREELADSEALLELGISTSDEISVSPTPCGLYGNHTRLINDPMGTNLDDNCEFVLVLYNGWPYAFVCCNMDIEGGDELLIEYGESYWSNN